MKLKGLAVVGGLGLIGAVCYFSHIDQGNYVCLTCISGQQASQWRMGTWEHSIPLASKEFVVRNSYVFTDFLAERNHEHDWKFAQGSPYFLFGFIWGGCGISITPEWHPFIIKYETKATFRKFVQESIHSGIVAKDNLAVAISKSRPEESLDSIEQDLLFSIIQLADEINDNGRIEVISDKMKYNKYAKQYIEIYPDLRKNQVNQCADCPKQGYRPNHADIHPNIKRYFEPLSLNSMGVCQMCEDAEDW